MCHHLDVQQSAVVLTIQRQPEHPISGSRHSRASSRHLERCWRRAGSGTGLTAMARTRRQQQEPEPEPELRQDAAPQQEDSDSDAPEEVGLEQSKVSCTLAPCTCIATHSEFPEAPPPAAKACGRGTFAKQSSHDYFCRHLCSNSGGTCGRQCRRRRFGPRRRAAPGPSRRLQRWRQWSQRIQTQRP